jgi:hypothetical protein
LDLHSVALSTAEHLFIPVPQSVAQEKVSGFKNFPSLQVNGLNSPAHT